MMHDPQKNTFQIDKELHLNRRHEPHANALAEHYCRRWLSIHQLNELAENIPANQPMVGIQRSKYVSSGDEYLCITIARPAYFPATNNVSVTIGIFVDAELKKKIKFLDDPAIPSRIVNVTCERCSILDCKERVAPPIALQKKEKKQQIQEALKKIMKA